MKSSSVFLNTLREQTVLYFVDIECFPPSQIRNFIDKSHTNIAFIFVACNNVFVLRKTVSGLDLPNSVFLYSNSSFKDAADCGIIASCCGLAVLDHIEKTKKIKEVVILSNDNIFMNVPHILSFLRVKIFSSD